MKKYILIIPLLFLFSSSCEEPDNNNNIQGEATIEILSPEDNSEFIYSGQPIEIIAVIENKESAEAAYISVDGNIIASGLNDTLLGYYEPPSNLNQNIVIQASLSGSNNETIASDYSTISINTVDENTLSSETIFMNIDNQFQIMRFPVTNRQFINFLNSNEQLEVNLGPILWTDINNDGYGDPTLCEFDSNDNYEPSQWWYISVSSNFANENIPADHYVLYKNGYNIYDSNADFSNQGGKIRYDCYSELFYLPNEEDGSESIYLDHPVTGVTWIGANVYANYFGWDIPTLEQWEDIAKGNYDWTYPWGNYIDENYANYNNTNTSEVGTYNGIGELNLSLSAFGLYDMGGNVWEHTSSFNSPEVYFKTGGAFNSDTTELKIGYVAYTLLEQVSNNTGFRCVANINYPSPPASGCMEENKCNYDMFAEESGNCFENDCLGVCGGDAQEYEFFEDADNDGLGNPDISEMQCNEPENGWCDNSNDLDDSCPSSDINQENIDCNNICNGDAFIDGCGNCVGGDTGQEECAEDCNGDDGGDANWDSCGVCAGGNTGLEPNQDLDCNGVCDPSTPQGEQDLNNGLEFGAFIDDCGDCVEGGTGLEENYADVGCGCDEPEAEYYCLDEDGNNCCDCGNNTDGNWEDCDPDLDADLICENDLEDNYIETILGCSNDNAENYYCDQEENECITFGVNVIPPCNFIDDGSCIIYGCTDPDADNYNPDATIDDGNCEYTTPLQVSFGAIDQNNGTMEINIIIPEYENESDYVYGFQFNIDGVTLSGAYGGLAEQNGFTVSVGGSTVIGFSLSGDYIGQGEGILTILNFTQTDQQACLNLGNGAFSNQNSQPIPVEFGDCYDF